VSEPGFTKLPEFPGWTATVTRGRVPYEGYRRGLAIEHQGWSEKAAGDSLFKLGLEAMGGRSVLAHTRLVNLYLLVTQFLDKLASRDIIEFGVYRGGSALFMARIMKELYPGAKFYALDTFKGMPATERGVDAHGPGDFGEADLDGFRAQIDKFGLGDIIEIHAGLFQETFPAIAARNVTFGLAHLDADIYSALKYAQDAVWPHMATGGYVVYDDATTSSCLGATQAVEELIQERRIHCEQVFPHFVFRAM
jgi:predicted O-methyltransferase YrrM